MLNFLTVGLGGFLGACLRYGLTLLHKAIWPDMHFPIGTLLANLIGCAAIGLVGALLFQRHSVSPHVALFLITGLLGGLTTFSSFSFETILMFRNGHALYAVLNIAISLIAGLGLAAWFYHLFSGASS